MFKRIHTAFITYKCKLFKHPIHWVYGEGVKILVCETCHLVHDVDRI